MNSMGHPDDCCCPHCEDGHDERVWCLFCHCDGPRSEHSSSPCRPVALADGSPTPDDGVDRDEPDVADSPVTMRDLA